MAHDIGRAHDRRAGERRMSAGELQSLLSEPLALDEMTVLQPTGKPTKRGATIAQAFKNAEVAGHLIVQRRVDGRAVAFMGVTTDAKCPPSCGLHRPRKLVVLVENKKHLW